MAQSPLCDKMFIFMGEFLKWLLRMSPPGILANFGKGAYNLFQKDESKKLDNTFSDIYKIFTGTYQPQTFSDYLGSSFGSEVKSLVNKETGAGLTDAEREQNAYTAMREDTRFQRTVADMQNAGLNTALLYGSSASAPSVNTSSGGIAGSGSLADFIQLAMLPLQMKAMEADIDRTKADTKNIVQRTRTEEQETMSREIAVQFMPAMSQAKLDEMYADIDMAYSTIKLNESKEVLIHNQSDAQEIINEYLPAKLQAEVSNINANTDKASEDAKLSAMRTSFERIQCDFARENHFLMSSSDSLQVAVYLGSLLGLTTSQVTEATKQSMDKVKKMLEDNPHYFD